MNNNQIEPIDFFKDRNVDFGYITASWILDFLALNNSDVLILVDNNNNPIYSVDKSGKHKRINVFNPSNIELFIDNDNCRPKIVKFWDIARKNVQIQISGTNAIFHRDAIIDIYRKHYEKYISNPYPLEKGWQL